MAQKITPQQLIAYIPQHLLIDVRTPAEFAQGHIPGACNIPLFSDEERVIIGTAYKQQGKEPAMFIALEYIGPRMRQLVETVKQQAKSKTIMVHCWRGGMRSASFAWLLEFFGYQVLLLEGGYKAFRAFGRAQFAQKRAITILSGATGSQKTKLLQLVRQTGAHVIDLEALAHHKGSVFGGLGTTQPTQEQFENNLACALLACPAEETVWFEDESRTIGALHIPHDLWNQMRQAPVKRLTMPFEQRHAALCAEYGTAPVQALISCVQRLEKHLGGARTHAIVQLLQENNIPDACRILMHYYDATYAYAFAKRAAVCVTEVVCTDEPLVAIAQRLCS